MKLTIVCVHRTLLKIVDIVIRKLVNGFGKV